MSTGMVVISADAKSFILASNLENSCQMGIAFIILTE